MPVVILSLFRKTIHGVRHLGAFVSGCVVTFSLDSSWSALPMLRGIHLDNKNWDRGLFHP
jgi:hypothetical protein